MRVVSLLVVISSLSVIWAQEAKKDNPPQEQPTIPTTLAEAHAALERTLSAQELARIDAMPSDGGMVRYHLGLGTALRDSWGLWRGSPLAKHMEELGFTHPDDMSGVILATFWCKRHGQDFRLKERAAKYKKYWDVAQKTQEKEEIPVEKAKAAIQKMMMGLQFERRDVPIVRVPDRTDQYLKGRFLFPFRGGVFLTAYRRGRVQDQAAVMEGFYVDPVDGKVREKPEYDGLVTRGYYFDPADRKAHKMGPGDDFHTWGYYFDPADRKIHGIRLPEVSAVYAAVVAGGKAWFAGITDGKAVLVGVNGQDRIMVPLPQEDETPDLGLDGQSLLAVYAKTIFRLTNRTWTLIHSGDILLPRSGLPPQRHGNMIFLRDEGRSEMQRHLWWLTLGENLHLSTLDRDVGVVGPEGPAWGNSFSYCATSNGDLWACVGDSSDPKSLLRRSMDGSYSIAIMNNSVRFTGDLLGSGETDQGLTVSGVAALPDDTLLLVGDAGLYRLKGNELVQELAFTNTRQDLSDSNGRFVLHWKWNPSNILVLDDKSYFISGSSGGVYLLHKAKDGEWSFLSLDEDFGDPVVW